MLYSDRKIICGVAICIAALEICQLLLGNWGIPLFIFGVYMWSGR